MAQQTADFVVDGLSAPARPSLELVLPLYGDEDVAVDGAYVRILKPAIDAVMAIIALVLVLPVLLAVALVVRIRLGPGIFYTQQRVGRGGREFTVYKFRTMHHDRRREARPCERDRRVCHKRADDPRHTALGRFLRSTSLDELPQLWNILRGQMSLVGPRPELPSVVATYEDWQHRRHCVKPGLTGLWQVEVRAEGKPMHLRTDLDVEYVERVGLGTDCRILARTIPALLRRTGN